MGQDEEMDTAPLAQHQPFFVIDKEKGKGSSEERKDAGDESDSGQDEDPNCPMEEEEEEGDDEVSITKKASAVDESIKNGESTKTNGNHHSESEESSEDEDGEEDEGNQTKTVKCLPVNSATECRTFAS